MVRPLASLVVVLTCAAGLAAQVKPAPDRRPDEGGGPYEKLAIRGAILIDGTGGPPRGPVTVVVQNNRIASIGRFAGRADRTVNATGMYLLPGFVDMHAHCGGRRKAPEAEYVYKLWMGHGVTTVRGVGLNSHSWTQSEKKRSAANTIVAPRIFDYQRPPRSLRTPEAAREWVKKRAATGIDGLKLGAFRPKIMAALIDEAHNHGLGTTAHLAQTGVAQMNAIDAARVGLDTVTHYYGHFEALLRDYVVQPWPADHNYNDEQHRFGQVARLWDKIHPPGSSEWKAYLREHLALGTVFDPTMCIYSAGRDVMRARTQEWHDEYTLPSLMDFFAPSRRAHGSYWFKWTAWDEVAWKNFYRVWMQLINDYKKMGGRVTTGSDSGFIYDTYGFGYIEELELLQEAGFHPLEVIQAATMNGALTLHEPRGEEIQFGVIREGLLADMILVEANPIEDLKVFYGTGAVRLNDDTGDVTRVGGVRWTIKDGIVYDAKRMRAEVRAMVRKQKRERAAAAAVTAEASASKSAGAVAPPPVAKVDPTRLSAHGHERIDDYYWLRERDDAAVRAYLNAENAHMAAAMAHTDDLRDRLFAEIKGRIVQDDSSAPYRDGDFWYYRRFAVGKQYPLWCRKKKSLEAPEQVLVDGNALAEGHAFFSMRGASPNAKHDVVCYAADNVGRRKYTLFFKDLASGKLLADVIRDVTGNFVWAGDGRTILYARQDPNTLRSYQIYRHQLGSDASKDALVFEEKDDTFSVRVSRSKSRQYLTITSSQTLRTEVRYRAAGASGEWRVFLPRSAEHRYSIDHHGDRWLIRSNLEAPNYRLLATPIGTTATTSWTEVVPHRADVFLDGFEVFRDYVVVAERQAGLATLRIMPTAADAEAHDIEFDEPAYTARLDRSEILDSEVVRFVYSSLTTPASTYDYNMKTRKRELIKRDSVLGGFDPANYVTVRLDAAARDGVSVPVSLVYRKGMRRDGENPLLLYGYGSYGSTTGARFQSARLSLLDRGFAFAIAHVRGGQIHGRKWYEDGKLLKKRNTFTDFIDVAEYLIAEGFTQKDRLFAMGGSAGGLLMGAVVNMRPDLFCGVVAKVPFVDVVTTMLDATIPLTTFEYDEWGDPNKKDYYDYMLSYSPYDNVAAVDYPHLLVTTGLHDSQVQYWEPAKWVAKLRATKTDGNRLLLKTNMAAGHGGASGRFERYRDTAFEYAFLLDLAKATR